MNDILWKTCRVLANETRLKILRCLFKNQERCVQNIAEQFHLSEVVASQHLKLLNEHGFLNQKRESKWVFYQPTVPKNETPAKYLTSSLESKLTRPSPRYSELIRAFTAFTHPRRIDITKTVLLRQSRFEELVADCSISMPALYRHLDKLVNRNVIKEENSIYCIVQQKSALNKALLLCCGNESFSHTS